MVDHKSIEAFNDEFFAYAKERLEYFGDIDAFANYGRCQSMDGLTQSAVWPFDDVYVDFDSVALCIEYLVDKNFTSDLLAERRSGTLGKASKFANYLMHYLTQNLMKTVVHMPVLDKIDHDKFEQNSMVLAKLPQWSYLLNVMDHDFSEDLGSVSFISICKDYKYFGKYGKHEHALSIGIVDAEYGVTTVFDLPLRSDLTIGQSVEALVDFLKDYIKRGLLGRRVSKKEADQASRFMRHSAQYILNLLIYLIDNQDKLKDSNGNAASLRPNTERTANSTVLDHYKIYAQYDTPLYLYLD